MIARGVIAPTQPVQVFDAVNKTLKVIMNNLTVDFQQIHLRLLINNTFTQTDLAES